MIGVTTTEGAGGGVFVVGTCKAERIRGVIVGVTFLETETLSL